MDQLILNKKTGFKNLIPHNPVVIRDFRGIIFYSTVGLNEVDSFNLPEGSYFIDQGLIKELLKPVPVTLMEMPRVERWMKSPSNFSIYFDENPNKCTIDWDSESITFDNRLKSSPLPDIFFILYHEYGHALYVTERYADMYAANLMLKKGYNTSQIGMSQLNALSSAQFERKNNLISRL